MRKFLILFIALASSLFAHSQELWTSLEAETMLTKKFGIGVTGEARWQQFSKPLKSFSGEVALSYKLFKPLSLGASYQLTQRNREQGFFSVHSFAAQLAYRHKIGNWRINYRNKFETDKNTYTTNEEDLRWQFTDRNRIKISYYKKSSLLSPSVFIESFNEISAQEKFTLAELRYGVGLDFMLYRGYSVGTSGLVKQSFDSKTEFTYIASISLKKEW